MIIFEKINPDRGMDRRDFIKAAAVAGTACMFDSCRTLFTAGEKDSDAGSTLEKKKKGQ